MVSVPPLPTTGPQPFWRVFVSEFQRDDILLRASALAYTTLAALVPIFAIVLAVLSGPAFQETRDKVIDQLAAAIVPESGPGWRAPDGSTHANLKERFKAHIQALAERALTVGIFGFLLLVVTVGLVFQTIENAFNVIWRAATRRSFFIRVAIATALMFWGPVILAVSVSLTEYLKALPFTGTYLAPVLFTTAAFTAFYMIMPHTAVRFKCALAAGACAALCWELAKYAFVLYVTRIVSYHRVYGSLGLIPVLFLWVYWNWVVILSGAELSYVLQTKKERKN